MRLEPDSAYNPLNVGSALRMMNLAGYPVGTGQERILGNRVTSHLPDLAQQGAFDAAMIFGTNSVPYLVQIGNKASAAWQQCRCARLQYQCLDFPQALKFQRKAVELAPKATQREWLNYELALLLYFSGQREEAQALASQTVQEIQQLNTARRYMASRLTDLLCRAQLTVIRDGESGSEKVLEWFEQSNKYDENSHFLNATRAMAHEELGDNMRAIDAYEKVVKVEYSRPVYPRFHFDDRLIELLDTTNQLDRGVEIFSAALETRSKDLPDRHPLIGLTQMRLADVLIRTGRELGRAEELLAQARKTMERHEITPEHVFERIDRLADKASAR